MTGVSVNIFRWDLGDCTNNGVSSCKNAYGRRFVLFDHTIRDGNHILEECLSDEVFVCLKVVRRRRGKDEYLHIEEIGDTNINHCSMFGGNFVYSSDSRFSDISYYPLPIHDRFE